MRFRYLGRRAGTNEERLYLVQDENELYLAAMAKDGVLELQPLTWDRLVEQSVVAAVRGALAVPAKVTSIRQNPPDPPETA